MTELQFYQITEWQKETFPSANALSKIAHLKQEVDELEEDVRENKLGATLEFADCFLLLFGAASAHGMTYQDITNAIHEKMNINMKRKWVKPDDNGVVNHIKP